MDAPTDCEVSLNVYWQRPIAFDENGRAQKRMGGPSELSWHHKLVQDMLGIYHVGVAVYGVEYSFGNSHAPHSYQLGGSTGGVVAHSPTQAGPHNVFKQSVEMGSICMTREHVEQIATQLSSTSFLSKSYNRFQHNCVDFAQELCSQLGVATEFPAWCHRASDAARIAGLGRSDINSEASRDFGSKGTLSTRYSGGPRRATCGFGKFGQAVPALQAADLDDASPASRSFSDSFDIDDLAQLVKQLPVKKELPRAATGNYPSLLTSSKVSPPCQKPLQSGAEHIVEVVGAIADDYANGRKQSRWKRSALKRQNRSVSLMVEIPQPIASI